MNDLVIRDTLIVDGSGDEPVTGDVAVRDGVITAVGEQGLTGKQLIDGSGLVLAPGIVDIHTHYDAQLTWDASANPSPQMGVTTVVVGNCGFGLAPCHPDHRDLTLKNLTKVEGMPLDALLNGVNWNFETFGEYLDVLAARGVVPNVAAFANHSCIRTYIMGSDAAKRPATPGEIKAIGDLLREALESGAIGLGTSTLESHNGEWGIPMPSRFACDDEFRELARVLGEAGRGIFQITKGAATSIQFIEELAALSGRPVQVCPMLQDPGHPADVFDCMEAYAGAASCGREIYGQVTPFPEIMDFNLREPYPLESLSSWQTAMAASCDEDRMAVFRDPSFRSRVKSELETAGAPFRFSNQWNTMTIKSKEACEDQVPDERSIAEMAKAQGKHPLDCMLDLALSECLETEFTVGMFNAEEDAVTQLLTHERACIGLGDAGAHLTFFCQAGTGLYLLQRFVRERGDLTLQDAIYRLTRQPAEAMRIDGRGQSWWGPVLIFCCLMLMSSASVSVVWSMTFPVDLNASTRPRWVSTVSGSTGSV
ncbi:MAG: amidohydrolase [Pseudomonadota bacterium]|nr:MAG: amidohydrolase [Pseudomonadota bacterium]